MKYTINGNDSGFTDVSPSCSAYPDWNPYDLYGDILYRAYGQDRILVISGKTDALEHAETLFNNFSPPLIMPGDSYLIRYDVRREHDGKLIARYERTEHGS